MPATLLLTPDLEDALVLAVEEGVPIETAAAAAGITGRTFYAWLQASERGAWREGQPVDEQTMVSLTRFSRRVAAAQGLFEAKQVRGVARAAEAVNEKTGLTDWRARAWLLNNHPRYRSRYKQEKQVEVHSSGTVTHEHELVQQHSNDLALLEQWAALPEPPTETQG